MSLAAENPSIRVESMGVEDLPLPESRPDSPVAAVFNSASSASDTDSPTVPEAQHNWGQLKPIDEQDIAHIVIDNDAMSNSGSDASSAEIDLSKSTYGSRFKSVTVTEDAAYDVDEPVFQRSKDMTTDSASVKSISSNDKYVTGSEDSESSDTIAKHESSSDDGDADAKTKFEKELDINMKKMCGDCESSEELAGVAAAMAPATISGNPGLNPRASAFDNAFFTDDIHGSALPTIHENEKECGKPKLQLKFSDYADLFIEAIRDDGSTCVFEVQSDILAAASTVFHRMVYDTDKRGNNDEWKTKWTWKLNDSAMGLKVLFALLHHKYPAAMFTGEPQPGQVYDILRVFEKYGINDEACHPWIKSWISGFRKGLNETTLTQLQRLFVSHKLGDFKSFKVCLRKVAHQVEIGDDGVLCIDGKPIQDVVPLSEFLVANIRAVRIADLKSLLEPFQVAYDYFVGDSIDECAVDYCKSSDGHQECNEKILGTLMSTLRKHELKPIPVPDSYIGTVDFLAKKVMQMEIRGLYVPNLLPHHQRHGQCKLGQDKVARDLLDCAAYLGVYDDLVSEMVVKTKLAGIEKDEKDEFDDYKIVFNTTSSEFDKDVSHDNWGWIENDEPRVSAVRFLSDDSGIGE